MFASSLKMRSFPNKKCCFLLLLFSISSPLASANGIDVICENHAVSCFSEISARQQHQASGSSQWWQLEILRLNSLFHFRKFDELYAVIRPWVNHEDVPVEYQPVINMLFGKWLAINNRKEEAKSAYVQSLSGYEALFEKDPSQETALSILNLLVSLERFESARDFVDVLETNNYNDAEFYREIFAELGHIALKSEHLEQHLFYREKSLFWAKQIDDPQQVAVAYNNYAVALRNYSKFDEARKAFLTGLTYAKAAKDFAQVNTIYLRLAEIENRVSDSAKAAMWLGKVDIEKLPTPQIVYYRKLTADLKTKAEED